LTASSDTAAHREPAESSVEGSDWRMPKEKADLAWYSAESRKQKLRLRCPIAHAELCPRYYRTLAVLGEGGHPGHAPITQIPSERAASLDRKWKAFESVVLEEEPSTFWAGEEDHMERYAVSHVCPEVSYEIFGYFASDLHAYADEMDRAFDKKDYRRESNFEQYDPDWESVTPRHYTECREYSIHGTFATGNPSKAAARRREISPRDRWKVLARDSFTCAYCGRKPPDVVLHVDHKVSIKDGGTNELENLVTSCDECNSGKGKSSV
jgi:HNH endonuclease